MDRHRAKTSYDESGAPTLEYTGVTATAAVIALSVLLALATVAPGVGDWFRQAICQVTTLGQGPCGAATSADQHRPPQPCVVSATSQSLRREVALAIVTAGDGRKFEVAKLSDGRYRVTQLTSDQRGRRDRWEAASP
ncbi:MAG: hypothetical protein M3N68_01175 [Actinomycetota bacterium]|nr:hypothetical protein [Actinomycetota bacterium]